MRYPGGAWSPQSLTERTRRRRPVEHPPRTPRSAARPPEVCIGSLVWAPSTASIHM